MAKETKAHKRAIEELRNVAFAALENASIKVAEFKMSDHYGELNIVERSLISNVYAILDSATSILWRVVNNDVRR